MMMMKKVRNVDSSFLISYHVLVSFNRAKRINFITSRLRRKVTTILCASYRVLAYFGHREAFISFQRLRARLAVNFDLAKDLENKRTLKIRASYEPRKSYIECECLRARYPRITQTWK